MKLLNHTLSYLSITFFLVIGIWAAFLYVNLLDEIYDSIDDGLENSKILIIQKAQTDSTVVHRTSFFESNYAIHQITREHALTFRDTYIDSSMYMVNEEDYEPVRILKTAFSVPGGKYYRLDVVSSMVEEDDLIEDLAYSILWLYIILLVSTLVINNVVLKRIWKPFYQILERLKNFRLESPGSETPVHTKVTEFQMLNESVNSLLDRTVETFNSQKQFIENASHEMQTPLAISLNKLELLAEKESLSDAEAQEIGSIVHTLERLTRLNKALLLLSKIENRQFGETSAVNINEIADRAVSELMDLAEYKSVQIEKHFSDTLTLQMNAQLALIMISNLLKNAIVHNVEGGLVSVMIDGSSVTVANTGRSEPLDSAHIFKRFYKGTDSTTSTGLGLAIVKSITDFSGLAVEYSFKEKHCFKILKK